MVLLKRAHVGARSAGVDLIEIVLMVDGRPVGSIERTQGGNYIVGTKGLIPALDGMTGASVDDVWAKIANKVATREVFLTKPITGVRVSN